MQGMLEGVSHSFTKNFHFIDSVKAYLSYALLRASVSQSPIIFQVWFSISYRSLKVILECCIWLEFMFWQYASGIFSVLLLRFRDSLKVSMWWLQFRNSSLRDCYLLPYFSDPKSHFQGEIGIFFPIIVLRSLDSSECPSDQKMGVLRYNIILLGSDILYVS